MLEIDEVSKVYKVGTFGGKELQAVSNVSFDIHKGEVVSLIGESGSGKSTIGRMILRLISVTSGTISFNGVDISTLKGRALKEYYRNVQGVFQDPFSSYNPIFKADRVFQINRDKPLAGIVFGVAYHVLDGIQPGSLRTASAEGAEPAAASLGTCIYFSFVTLATLGYGDVVPASELTRMLATLEAVGAQLYLAVLIARLVGLYARTPE